MKFTPRIWIGTAAVCVVASGCSQSSSPHGAAPLNVSFMTRATTNAAASRVVIHAADVTTTVGQHTLTITRAQVVLSRIELRGTSATACGAETDAPDQAHDQSHDAGCEGLELAPMLVDLPVDSAIVSALHVTIPAGTYTALEATLEPAHGNDGSAAPFLAANPAFAGVSVRVKGTFDGHAFVYTGAPQVHLELEFTPALTVADAGANITVHADLSRWFVDATGGLVDPATANASGVNASLVANNIQRSFRATGDDRGDAGRPPVDRR
jgi:hypothetical protein